MAYNELIKNFARIRAYMREFYIYGFKSRDEYDAKSARSYDDERRRIESWLGDYMQFRRTPEGKIVFISIDSRSVSHNPLYKALKSRSFTDGDITLHFILMDILSSPEKKLPLNEIIEKIDSEYLSRFKCPMVFDESTIRKKLKEYVGEGIVTAEKQGRRLLYSRSRDVILNGKSDFLDFFSEAAPCGAVGSFILDKLPEHKSCFTFKHHYINSALDSEVLYSLFSAIRKRQLIKIEKEGGAPEYRDLVYAPLYIYISVRNGRQHLMVYAYSLKRFIAVRIDHIDSVKLYGVCEDFDELRERLKSLRRNMWGVSCPGTENKMEHIEFIVKAEHGEEHIYSRLLREKRCGTVEKISDCEYRFSADFCDTNEMIPWIRSFICRITHIEFSNMASEQRFKNDIREMYRIYGIGEGGEE